MNRERKVGSTMRVKAIAGLLALFVLNSAYGVKHKGGIITVDDGKSRQFNSSALKGYVERLEKSKKEILDKKFTAVDYDPKFDAPQESEIKDSSKKDKAFQAMINFAKKMDQASAAFESCKEDESVTPIRAILKQCSERIIEIQFLSDDKKDLLDNVNAYKPLYQVCGTFLTSLQKWKKENISEGEKLLLTKFNRYYHDIFNEDFKSIIKDNPPTDIQEFKKLFTRPDSKTQAYNQKVSEFVDELFKSFGQAKEQIEKLDKNKLCKLEVDKDKEEIISEEEGKKRTEEKENKDGKEPKDKTKPDPGNIQGGPGHGLTERAEPGNPQPTPAPSVQPTPTAPPFVPTPVPFQPPFDPGVQNNNPFDLKDLLPALLANQLQQTPPPEINRQGDRSAQGGNRTESPQIPPQFQPPFFPQDNSNDEPQQPQDPGLQQTPPPLIQFPGLPSSTTSSNDNSTIQLLNELLKQNNATPTPVPTPSVTSESDILQKAQLDAMTRRQEMMMQMFMAQQQQYQQNPNINPTAPISARQLFSGQTGGYGPSVGGISGGFGRSGSSALMRRFQSARGTSRGGRYNNPRSQGGFSGGDSSGSSEIRGNLGTLN